jgi:hypothetical protein
MPAAQFSLQRVERIHACTCTTPAVTTATATAPALPNLAVFDQGGASGAAGPASAPGSALARPARHTPGHATQDTQIEATHTGTQAGAAHSCLPHRPIVQLAGTTSMAALRAVARDRLTPAIDPAPAPMDPGAYEEERARPGNGASLNSTRRTCQCHNHAGISR